MLQDDPIGRAGCLVAAVLLLASSGASAEDWTRWGGPRGDFTVRAGALAESWPENGPPRLWERELGGGYASVLSQGDRLFTMFRDGDEDVLIALDAATGSTLWEHRDTYSFWPGMDRNFGIGPNSTPLWIEDRLVGIGISGRMRALDATSGQLRWSRDLPAEFGRRERIEEYGYSANPLPYNGTILTLVGGDEAAVVAFDPTDGSVVWTSAPGGVSYAQPAVMRLAGRDHFVYFEPEGVVALDPATGETLWRHPIEFNNGNHLTPATRCDENHLWISSQFDSGGGRLLKVTATPAGLAVEERWFTPKLRASHWTLHCRGDILYGSIGGNATSRIAAVRWETGEFLWQERGFHKAQALWADGKLLFLDQRGTLGLARVSPKGFELLASVSVAEPEAWTLPTLVGTTLYVRSGDRLLALDLAARPAEASADASSDPWIERSPYAMPFATRAEWLDFMSQGGTIDTMALAKAFPQDEFEGFLDGTLATVERVAFRSADLILRGILVSPPGDGPFPTVIYARGGNREYGTLRFLDVVRMLAIAQGGRVVLAPEYRGEGGSEGEPELAGGDIDDVLAALRALERWPPADTERRALMGFSRGGLVAAWALTRRPGFDAVVLLAPSLDLEASAAWRPEMDEGIYAKSIAGYAEDRLAALRRASPIHAVDRMEKTPILILHGTADRRVHPAESLDFSRRLLDAKHRHRLLMLEDGRHVLEHHAPLVRSQIDAWLTAYLGGENGSV